MCIYQEITDRIVAELEQGTVPWVKPWSAATAGGDRNVVSGKPYRGINCILLAMAGFQSQYWATYKQWAERGAQVRKGQHGTRIVFWQKVDRAQPDAAEEDDGKKSYLLAKTYVVFNADQVDNAKLPAEKPVTEAERIAAGEEIIKNSHAKIFHDSNEAYYRPATDDIHLPTINQFVAPENYYATAFHELTHWTSHKERCDRDISAGKFGNAEYAFEELVAELGAAFVCGHTGIKGDIRHAAYIGSWLRALRDDKKAIFKAASLAQKAANFLLVTEHED